MKIAIISSTFPEDKPGGVGTYVDGRAAYLSRKASVRVFALGRGGSTDYTSTYQKFSLGFPNRLKKDFLFVWWKLIVQIIRWKPDVVEIHNIPIGLPMFIIFLFSGVRRPTYFFHGPARLEAKIEGASLISCFFRYSLEKFCLFQSRSIYCVSHAFKKTLGEEHRFIRRWKNVKIRYPKVRLPEYPRDAFGERNQEGQQDFVCVRRLVERTGTALLLDAFLAGKEANLLSSDARLRIVGEGPQKELLQRKIRDSKFGGSVELLGRVSQIERDKLFASSTYNVVPTIGLEGFGLVVVEAAFLGCPTIVTNVNALPEVIAKLDGMGVVVAPTRESITDALVHAKALTSDQRDKLGNLARRKFGVL